MQSIPPPSPHNPSLVLHFRAELHALKMTLHPPIKMHQSTSYSSLIPPPVIDGPTGAGLVPIIPYKRASKWNSTVNKHHDPFVVNFDTRGMPEGYGVKHGDLTSYSLMIMNTVIVRGSDTVRFPPGKKIQLRIVVSSTGNVQTVGGQFV